MLAYFYHYLHLLQHLIISLEVSTIIAGIFYYGLIIFIFRYFTSKTFFNKLAESDMSLKTIIIEGVELPATATFSEIDDAIASHREAKRAATEQREPEREKKRKLGQPKEEGKPFRIFRS